MGQATLTGDRLIGTFSCEHREHRIPSENVRVMKEADGFVLGCACGPEALEDIADPPHRLGYGHVVLVAPPGDARTWLALDDEAEGWFGDPDTEPVGGGPTNREGRAEKRQQMEARVA